MQTMNAMEINLVSGGNAQDTVTGSFGSGSNPPAEAGLGNVGLLGIGGALLRLGIRYAPRLLILL